MINGEYHYIAWIAWNDLVRQIQFLNISKYSDDFNFVHHKAVCMKRVLFVLCKMGNDFYKTIHFTS